MAGDWIKFEHATANKPEMLLAAELLGLERRTCVGLFMDYWIWLDANLQESRNGFVTLVSRRSLEEALRCVGFAAVLERIGWATFDDEACTLYVVNYGRHNGNTAKSRALSRDRQNKFRNAKVTAPALPEKRREEKSIKDSMSSSQANIDATALLGFLNKKAQRSYRPTANTLKPIIARLKEGYTPSECRSVVVRRWRAWKDDPKMAEFLRPATLFGAEKFSQYVGEVPTADEWKEIEDANPVVS